MDLLHKRNVSLDCFRGIMALFVACGHFFYWNHKPIIPCSFVLAVDFFLVLSGFVICHSVYQKREKFNSINFAFKRYLRLFPVYIVCVVISYVFNIFNNITQPNLFDWFKILTISEMIPLNTLHPSIPFEPIGISYTISAELWVGIIIFPIFVTLLDKFTHLIFPVLILVILYCLIVLNQTSINYMDAHHRLYNLFIDYAIIRCLLEYSLGILTYLIFIKINFKPNNFIISFFQLFIILLFSMIYLKLNYNRNNEFIAPFLFAIFIYLLSFKTGIIYKITSNNFAKFLGDISYSVYLIHPIWINICSKYFHLHTTKGINIVIYIFCILTSAYIIYQFVDKPCLQLLRYKNNT